MVNCVEEGEISAEPFAFSIERERSIRPAIFASFSKAFSHSSRNERTVDSTASKRANKPDSEDGSIFVRLKTPESRCERHKEIHSPHATLNITIESRNSVHDTLVSPLQLPFSTAILSSDNPKDRKKNWIVHPPPATAQQATRF